LVWLASAGKQGQEGRGARARRQEKAMARAKTIASFLSVHKATFGTGSRRPQA
jgi:hypothetical protein